MSPRAACRLATLGFEQVYDFMPSKVDWMARGLPMEGANADAPRAIDFARQDVVTCRLDDTVGSVRPLVAASPHGFAFVTTADCILLGRLRKAALEGDADRRVGEVMEPGPSTSRPDLDPGELLAKLQKTDLTTAVLSDPEGRLLGIVRRTDLDTDGATKGR
jgi:predicted transcriptional regulator